MGFTFLHQDNCIVVIGTFLYCLLTNHYTLSSSFPVPKISCTVLLYKSPSSTWSLIHHGCGLLSLYPHDLVIKDWFVVPSISLILTIQDELVSCACSYGKAIVTWFACYKCGICTFHISHWNRQGNIYLLRKHTGFAQRLLTPFLYQWKFKTKSACHFVIYKFE